MIHHVFIQILSEQISQVDISESINITEKPTGNNAENNLVVWKFEKKICKKHKKIQKCLNLSRIKRKSTKKLKIYLKRKGNVKYWMSGWRKLLSLLCIVLMSNLRRAIWGKCRNWKLCEECLWEWKTFDISESIKITEKPTVNNAENNLVV